MLQIIRIDHRNQIIYVQGPGIPGDQGEIVRIYDWFSSERKLQYDVGYFINPSL